MSDELVKMSKDEIAVWLSGSELPEIENADEITLQIALRIVNAATAQDVLAPQEVLHGDEYVGKPFVVRDVSWRRSRVAGAAAGRYAFMDIVDANGEPQVMTCGSVQVVLQLGKLQAMDALPCKVVICTTDAPTAAGGFPLWLETAADF